MPRMECEMRVKLGFLNVSVMLYKWGDRNYGKIWVGGWVEELFDRIDGGSRDS